MQALKNDVFLLDLVLALADSALFVLFGKVFQVGSGESGGG